MRIKTLTRGPLAAASVIAALAMLSSPAIAANGAGGSGSGGTGGGDASGGGGSGSVYADLNVVLRADNGTPVLKKYVVPPSTETGQATTEYCVQPVSYSPITGVAPTVNPVDGRTVWVVPLQGEWAGAPPSPLPVEEIEACDPQPQYAMFVSAVDLERLNLARTSDTVIAQKLASVQGKLQLGTNITLEPTGRISIDGVPVDAAPENAAIYESLMTSGTVPGLPAGMAGPPAVIGPPPTGSDAHSQFQGMELAAMAIGASADKGTPLSIDAVEYYNQVIGFPPATDGTGVPYTSPWGVHFLTSTDPGTGQPMSSGQQYVDYSTFSYNRSQTFKGSVTWLDVPTLTWKVSRITEVVPFTNLSSYPEIGEQTLHGVTAFAQFADDVRALCDFIPDNTYIPGYYMDVPGVDTTAAQMKAVTDPAVDLGSLPASVFQTYPFQMTASLFNPFGGTLIDGARLRVTVRAPGALTPGALTATATDGQVIGFTTAGDSLTGWWGPETGFPVNPGYSQSTTFDVTVAEGAPTGDYDVTLDLVKADDPLDVLASGTGTVPVLPDRTTVLWGEAVPRLATEDEAMSLPLVIYSPSEGTGQLTLTVTGPGDNPATPESEALAPGDIRIYASNGTDMVAMPLALNEESQLVGTWGLALAAGYTPLTWFVTVTNGSPVGNYSFDVSMQGAGSPEPITVPVAAPESHGQRPPGTGDDTTTPVVTLAPIGTVGSTASFTLTADVHNVTFTCQLFSNGVASPAQACATPVTFTDLQPGTYVLSVVGTDRAGASSDPVTYSWTVGSSPSSVLITSASGTTLTAGHGTSFTVKATGTSTPKLALVGTLPQGVTFADNGDGTATLGGVPVVTAAGTYALTVLAWDATSSTVQTFELTVLPDPGAAPTITSPTTASFQVGNRSTFTVTATGAPTVRLAVAGDLPNGVSFTDNGDGTGVLSGTPAAVGVYQLTVIAANGVLPDATRALTVTVTAVPMGDGTTTPALPSPNVTPDVTGSPATSQGVPPDATGGAPVTVTPTGPAGQPSVAPTRYWLASRDGDVFAFAAGQGSYRSTGTMQLHAPLVGMATTAGGHGYWLVASDGGIFSFGDARFYGSTGNKALKHPIVAMAATPSGNGYWLVASDGEVFGFNAPLLGSLGATALTQPVIGMASGA